MAKKKGATKQFKQFKLKPTWTVGDDIVGKYATHLVVQGGEHECTILFFEVKPPFLLGSEAENIATLEALDGRVRADCVGRIIVANGRVPEFIKAIQSGFEKGLAAKARVAELQTSKTGTNGKGQVK